MNRDVFVIHAPEDAPLASHIVQFLEQRGVEGWIRDRDFGDKGEDEEKEARLAALAAARVLIVIFSAAANGSRAAQNEVQRALESSRLIIPFRIADIPPAGAMELLLRRRYSIAALRPPLETALEELHRVIKPFANQRRAPKNEASISRTLPARALILPDVPAAPVAREPMGPFQAAIKCPHLAAVGVSAEIELIVANQGGQILELVEVSLSGETLAEITTERVPDLSPGTQARLALPFRPTKPGPCVLRVSLEGYDSITKVAYGGTQALTVGSCGEETIVGGRGRAPLPEHPEVTRASMTFAHAEEAVLPPTITLPDDFEPLPLTLDYAHSLDAESAAKTRATPAIPFAFLGQHEDGMLLTLERMDGATALPHQDIRLSARLIFAIGRSREESDFVTWYWPRNEIHDAKTLRLSKKQCSLVLEKNECRIRNNATGSITTFDEMVLPQDDLAFKRRGTLTLSGNYRLEVIRMQPVDGAPLEISNLEKWKGPISGAFRKARGCVAFRPASPNFLPQRAVWLLSEAMFGTSHANGVVLDLPGMAEIQGRFHYHENCFWLENIADNGAVVINDQVVKPRTIVPLMTGKIIKLAGVRFFPRVVT